MTSDLHALTNDELLVYTANGLMGHRDAFAELRRRLSSLRAERDEARERADLSEMALSEGRELMAEWAAEAMKFSPVLACQCDSCKITRGLAAAEADRNRLIEAATVALANLEAGRHFGTALNAASVLRAALAAAKEEERNA